MSTPEVRTNGHAVHPAMTTDSRVAWLEWRLTEVTETAKEAKGLR
jgi:hypothetical protein